ncbi:Protein of unknown function [Pyronema omphalodes CBS 100304]|uniref:Uncharacterized protein n=1 Tax=Pyronema omphalodes (strain CBS 100304) TaxID=1076935 RepID=U4L3M5_PYROM|nr:Protein of unknown function [Pyronema omphalodes CBS 100304]
MPKCGEELTPAIIQ